MASEGSITCPHCAYVAIATIPDDACVFFFDCPNCHKVLRPLPGDCCVFCSFGDHKCPAAADSVITTLDFRSRMR